MKKVIEGKSYNTETAEKIADWNNGYYGGDFRLVSETLYKTKKGAYFLHGYGGPMSEYAVQRGSDTSGSTEIIPLTRNAAYHWAEEHCDADVVEQEFADKIEEA